MATTTHVPVEVYLRSSYEPDAEYVGGKIEKRPKDEFDHASWQAAILTWFRQHKVEWGVLARAERRVRVFATRFRVSDVTVIDRNLAKEKIITHPPLAVFEVLSTEYTIPWLKKRLEDYRVMGVPEIRVVNPQDNSYSRYDGGELRAGNTVIHTAKGITFDMNEIKNLLDD